MCYLSLNDGYFATNLLSEIYYRNKKGIAYADYDINKKAPEPITYSSTNKKIPGTQIKNAKVLEKFREAYGDAWAVGNDTSHRLDIAYHCGFIKDIYDNYHD
jgi:hypothetical protein